MMRFRHHILFSLLAAISVTCSHPGREAGIDRHALVGRHLISHSTTDPLNSLTVGNGKFAFTADITGLQTFPASFRDGIPLGTHSDFGWHSFPNPENFSLTDVEKYYRVGPDTVPYIYQFTGSTDERKNAASLWLRENPHRLHLGLIGLEILKNDSTPCEISDISDPFQSLDMWTGELKSTFVVDGSTVEVITFCHQDSDQISCRIRSDLIRSGKLGIKISFPYAAHAGFRVSCDFTNPGLHETTVTDNQRNSVTFLRRLDQDRYYVKMQWKGKARVEEVDKHSYTIFPGGRSGIFEWNCRFSSQPVRYVLPGFDASAANNRRSWKEFWNGGGAVDFSGCSDLRARELERRVVLSQYLTKIQCTGPLPPQETGLTFNSWYGKFHLEMHWWHMVHFFLWNREPLVRDQVDYYFSILHRARATAASQGYRGARWPKMIGPDGRESPSKVGTFLIWQQPHIIYFAELLYRLREDKDAILKKYSGLVDETAEFMASYARPDSESGKYVLGPALIPAQECFSPETTINPVFEMAYWYWGLQVARQWRLRQGLEPGENWQHVIDQLAGLSVADSLYLFSGDAIGSYTNPRYLTDHPMVAGILGFLPGTDMVDNKILLNSLEEIQRKWNRETIWGWDPPMLAMCAASLAMPEMAVDFLMMDTQKNTYLMNGHNYQDERLTIYLPGNGALLAAVAHMCTLAGTRGSSGFPDDGKWNVKYENLNSLH